MAVPNMIVTLAMNASKYSSGLKKAANDTNSFGKFTTTAFNFAKGAMLGLTMAALRYIPILAQMGADSRKADIQLKFMLENMQGVSAATDKTVKRMAAYADKVNKATGIDDEQIKAVQRKLLVFKTLRSTADELGSTFDRTTQAAIDLAAGGFGEMETNAIKLGRMLENPTKNLNALTRAGITFTDAEKRKIKKLQESGKLMEAQDIVLGSIENRVKGLAETSATPFDKLTAQFQQIGDAIGEAMLPALEEMNLQLSKWLGSKQGKKDIEDIINAFVLLAEAINNVAKGLAVVKSWWDRIIAAAKDYAKTTDNPAPPNKGGYGTDDPTGLKGLASASVSAPVTINFNTPIDSVSAGREVSRVLSDFQRANGGR